MKKIIFGMLLFTILTGCTSTNFLKSRVVTKLKTEAERYEKIEATREDGLVIIKKKDDDTLYKKIDGIESKITEEDIDYEFFRIIFDIK